MPQPEILLLFKVLLLIGIANGAPVLGKFFLQDLFNAPLDGGRLWRDGRPLFGSSKTVRGVVLAVVATALAAPLLGFSLALGVAIAVFAMLGDLTSSFIKRRRGMASSSMAFGLDQIPESLFPLLAVRVALDLDPVDVVALVAIFVVLELALSRLLFKLRIRDRPY